MLVFRCLEQIQEGQYEEEEENGGYRRTLLTKSHKELAAIRPQELGQQ
jgi:hypothetical protein